MSNTEIDYSDLPRQAVSSLRSRPSALIPAENKQQITSRLDIDVLNFFKSAGTRYQNRINAALREYMNTHRNTGS